MFAEYIYIYIYTRCLKNRLDGIEEMIVEMIKGNKNVLRFRDSFTVVFEIKKKISKPMCGEAARICRSRLTRQ